jgi:hypothetical protein
MKVSVKYWRSSIVVVMVGMALIMSAPVVFASANPNPGVLPPQSHPHGRTYGEWSNAWWQWALSIPTSVNPLLDTTGANCSEGQSGHVWFLAGTFSSGTATRSCTIPAGMMLFFPIVNTSWNNVGDTTPGSMCPPTTFTESQLRQILDRFIQSVTTLEADVDGVNIQNLQGYRAGSNNPTFSITLPSDNIYNFPGCTIPAGTYDTQPSVSDGYYLMLAPLKPGTHTIHFKGETSAVAAAPPLPALPTFTTEVTYNLTVK